MTPQPRIALAGVGHMGIGIASNLLKAGYALRFLDREGNQPTAALVRAGAQACPDRPRLAQGADILILCVTGAPEVESALFEGEGLAAHLKPGALVIDCSTSLPATSEAVARRLAQGGIDFLDAPMTRTPKEAAEGRLNLIVGGDAALLERVRPLLMSFAENITHAGPIGAGHRLKLVHNFVSLGFSAVLAEAAAGAARAGIDTGALLEVLGKGGGGGVVFERLRPFIESGDSSGFRFSLANAAKDLGYYTEMTQQGGQVDQIAHSILETYRSGLAERGDGVVPELVSLLAAGPST
ncbi:NAD(P)-dependent oxidoreductase [Aestuariirhabdus litorea]|uniref:NAD(P)-dependent oxidoreductase n=1 Tax=Aestuariirhabdus litorea TaxID=2528527 RepID=A0A3P3VMP3_9GAMM|nr:NAD(P)-dependent oxidoreductase [Aestuariirhabdus litorea]RRJ84032.1 NAD(P)-dependent oxidoreductase [Aestuariirhabdus litorea]RWW97252.1 NAD(P)-dependent oxidoreductase [Endozoicomonadaceae bacterium GTF-13]